MRVLMMIMIPFALFAASCATSTVDGPDDVSLTLVRPANQTLKPGETNEISIAIVRKNFNGAVPLKFSGLPRNVEIVERDHRIEAGDSIRTFTLYAAPGADRVVDRNVRVRAEGPNGIATTQTFRVTIQ